MKPKIVMLMLLILFIHSSACSQERNLKITGIYSNLSYSEGSGDIAGTEIIIMQAGSSMEYYIVFQDAEGQPKVPLVIKPIINKNRIEFSVPQIFYSEDGKEFIQTTNYNGTIKENGIELEGQNTQTKSKWKTFLKRKNSYWQ